MAQQPMFTVAEAAELANMKPATVRLWLRDGLIGTTHDQIPEVSGATSFLSVDTVFALAVAAWLRQLGAHPTIACKAGVQLAQMKVPQETMAPSKTDKESTGCACVTVDGDASFISIEEPVKTVELQNGAWILPYGRIATKILTAARDRRSASSA